MELKDYQARVLADLASYLDVLDGTPNLAQAFKDYWAGKGVRVGGGDGMEPYKNTVPGHEILRKQAAVGIDDHRAGLAGAGIAAEA